MTQVTKEHSLERVREKKRILKQSYKENEKQINCTRLYFDEVSSWTDIKITFDVLTLSLYVM